MPLPVNWKDHFWSTGHFKAVSLRIKDRALQFFRSADVELIRVATLLQRQHSDTRFGLALLFGFGDITRRSSDVEGFERMLRRCVEFGLVMEGRPGRSAASSDYFTTMRHKSTPLVGELSRILELAKEDGISFDD